MDVYDRMNAARDALRPGLAECPILICPNGAIPIPVETTPTAVTLCGVCGHECAITFAGQGAAA